MKDTIIQALIVVAFVAQPVFLFYFLLYNTYTLSLVILSARQVRRRVAGHFVEDLDLIDRGDLTKPLTMIVPAYNEEVTIVDSVTSLVHCDYPRHEIVVVNDGSTDGTLEPPQAGVPAPPHRHPVPRGDRHRAGCAACTRRRSRCRRA